MITRHHSHIYTVTIGSQPIADCASRQEAEEVDRWSRRRLRDTLDGIGAFGPDDLAKISTEIGAEARRHFGYT